MPEENGTQLIVVKQLPVIENQLRSVKEQVEKRVTDALSLICTADTYKTVKAERSNLNKEFQELENLRKRVKSMILQPYEDFEAVYKECVANIYKYADEQLKAKIKSVEDELRQEKEDELRAFFKEYSESVGIKDDSLASLEMAGIKIGLSDSMKSLREKAAAYIERVRSDLLAISTQDDKEEIMAEYRVSHDLASALMIVKKRHEAIEAERKRLEAIEQKQEEIAEIEETIESTEDDEISAPVAAPDPEEEERVYEARFAVKGTLKQLKALKEFLINGGYEYGSIDEYK